MSPPHPRDDFAPLRRLEEPAAAIEFALARGRLHHAWLVCGPRGVGKSRLAYRFARRLLGAQPDARGDPLGASPDDRVSRLIAARAHPDFLALHREADDAKPRRVIPVDEVRRLPEFFSKAPSHGEYRVAIIDAADDLNANGANAVLKTLEEPPARGVLILVSHNPGRLLDTLRSRCRRLNLSPWPQEALETWLEAQGLDRAAAVLAQGSPGRALAQAAGGGGGDLEIAVRALLDALPAADEAALQKLAEGFRGADGPDRFAYLFERLADQLRQRLSVAAGAKAPPGSDGWAAVWTRLTQTPDLVEGLNLDRGDAFSSVLADLRAAARAYPLPC